MARLGNRSSQTWFSDEGVPTTRDVSVIERRRAEILGLIATLQKHRHAEGASPASRRVAKRNGAAVVKTLRHSVEPEVSFASAEESLRSSLEDLERRVRRLEQDNGGSVRLGRSAPPRSLVPERQPRSLAPEQAPSSVLSGVIQGQLLSDVLQLISSNSLTGVFTVECRRAKASLYFDEGRIVHASGHGLEGEQAFFSIFGFDTGRYYFQETKDLPPQRTINSNTQFLILEALRQIDESRGD